ncbi:hypothetical protein [Neorhizobium sp. NCHU2750]|uniref:hypothetical protein n=1 Tax=Neorhizobium sp. NCHU2750 TaxID=1825976 RepID=UPI000EB6747C|nr:hypothetical protein NCHU2750_16430 [Neorhizobium sp. NCHU2750]
MRIGVVCEGPTDFFAIKYFLGAVLRKEGREVDFIDLQPSMDATSPKAGWGNIERWLAANTPQSRSKRYFSGGIFADDLDAKACDFIIVQMDCDHLEHEAFTVFNQEKYGINYGKLPDLDAQYNMVEKILGEWCGLSALTSADANRHVLTPAQQSTESWCIAAYSHLLTDPDLLEGQDLIDRFMTILHESEGRLLPASGFSEVDKSIKRREKFCKKHAANCTTYITRSNSFVRTVEKTIAAM